MVKSTSPSRSRRDLHVVTTSSRHIATTQIVRESVSARYREPKTPTEGGGGKSRWHHETPLRPAHGLGRILLPALGGATC